MYVPKPYIRRMIIIDIDTPWLSESAFRNVVTTGVEFSESFNNVMYKQVDGVAMGSPLGPVLRY